MTDAVERHQRIKALFAAASERPEGERAAWLAANCDDAGVRAEVGELLRYAAEDSSLLGVLAAEPSPTATPPTPRRLGRFTLLRKIAEGGMGTVWEAEQDAPRRRVAVKVIRAGLGTAAARRRFELEAELLGRLRHPAIAQVFEAGNAGIGDEGEPVPYLAMELVDGVPLHVHAERDPPSDGDAAARIAEIADAIEHAHQRGILHRDLKPSNVLIDGDGRPKVVDFGIARAIDARERGSIELTLAGQIIGTLGYMSPEQAAGDPDDVDTRTDVHALGVMLYELLSGELPVDVSSCTFLEAARRVQEREPVPITQVRPDLDADLATIVDTAVARDRERRYASAANLAADLRRHLAHEPIAARPASRIYQVRKFARRHRALVAGVAATMIALLAGLIATAVEARRAETARIDALQRSVEAEAVRDFLLSILRTVRPGELGRDATVRAAIEEVEGTVDETFADTPRVEAAVRIVLGRTWSELGEWERAADHLRRGLAVGDRGDVQQDARLRFLLGHALLEIGDYAAGEALLLAASATWRATDRDGEAASALLSLASLLEVRGETERAHRLSHEAIALSESGGGVESEPFAIALNNHANRLRVRGDLDPAERAVRRAQAILREIGRHDSANFARMQHNLALIQGARGAYAEAVATRRSALDLVERHLGDDHADVAVLRGAQAGDLVRCGRIDEAAWLAEASLTARSRIFGDDHLQTAVGRCTLSAVRRQQGEGVAAVELASAAVEALASGPLGPGHRLTLHARLELVRALLAVGDADAALERSTELVAAIEDGAPRHRAHGVHWRAHGRALAAAGRELAAREALETSARILAATTAVGHPERAATAAALAALRTR